MNKLILVLILCGISNVISSQILRSDLVDFIENQINSSTSGQSSQTIANSLCSQIKSEYRLISLDPYYSVMIASIISIQRNSKSHEELNQIENRIYYHAISSLFLSFLSETNNISAKSLDCENSKTELNFLLKKLPSAITALINCIQDYNIINKSLDIAEMITTLDGLLDSQRVQNSNDPNHPNYYWWRCRDALNALLSLNRQIRSAAERCN